MQPLHIKPVIIDRDAALHTYLRSISRYPLLSVHEEQALAQRIQQGDEQARTHLVHANLRFVVSIASQYPLQGLDLLDLISEGNSGLVRATHHFDPLRGCKFITLAVYYIRQAIVRALYTQGRMVHLPYNKVTQWRRIQAYAAHYQQEQGVLPTAEQTAEALHLSPYAVRDLMDATGACLSLDQSGRTEEAGEEGSTAPTLADTLSDPEAPLPSDAVEQTDQRQLIVATLRLHLTPQEYEVVTRTYGIGCPEESAHAIGMHMGLSAYRVRQILKHCLLRLRKQHLLDALAQA